MKCKDGKNKNQLRSKEDANETTDRFVCTFKHSGSGKNVYFQVGEKNLNWKRISSLLQGLVMVSSKTKQTALVTSTLTTLMKEGRKEK